VGNIRKIHEDPMQISFGTLELPSKGVLVLLVEKDKPLEHMAAEADKVTNSAISNAIKTARFKGDFGQKLEVLAPSELDAERVLLVGIGEADKLTEAQWLEVGATVTSALQNSGSTEATVIAGTSQAVALGIAEGALLRTYRFDKYRTKEADAKKPTLQSMTVATQDAQACTADFEARSKVADGVFMTRDLISEPANILHPESFADQIKEMEALGLEVDVLGEAEMAKLGMGSLLSVGQGSDKESQLVVMRWNGGKDGEQPISFVGKGVTFDTGGISLKPGEGMEQMKWDMGGAGTVVGLMKALAGRKANVNVVATVGLVENMPSGNASRPGDVVTSMSGQTIEILNTDAEGRLVLADAIWYTKEEYKPKFIIDLATLTGAIIISLGHEHAGIFSNDDTLCEQLDKAGAATGDKVWRMPLHKNYDKLIDCHIADMKNIGGRAAGSITAAQFLQRFVDDVPWVHIDIAAMVWSEKDLPLSEKGGTGYGVRLLDRMVADNYEG
jgi:leucyl aminopeptidase